MKWVGFSLPKRSSLLLPCLHSSCLGSFLAITPYHDHREKAADNGGAKYNEDDRDTDGPLAWQEQGVEEVVVVDEWLRLLVGVQRVCMAEVCTMKSVQMV